MLSYDVTVVGGGPAGAASALTCAQLGFKTLLLERGRKGRHKLCAGVLPLVCKDILDRMGLKMPNDVLSTPNTIGLYYVPPSGSENAGLVRNYRLLNIDRSPFDQWLRNSAENRGVEMWYEAKFLDLKQNTGIRLSVEAGSRMEVHTRFLIGADGVFSKVRRQICNEQANYLYVLQEYWKGQSIFDDCFHTFFSGEITPTYAYVMPKDGQWLIGTGAPKDHYSSATECLDKFKAWLIRDFEFKPSIKVKSEAWAIPYGFNLCGSGPVIPAGDAGGFCNALSGEGIRFALETGLSAGESVNIANRSGRVLSEVYSENVEEIKSFVEKTYRFASNMTDERREGFVKAELSRIGLT